MTLRVIPPLLKRVKVLLVQRIRAILLKVNPKTQRQKMQQILQIQPMMALQTHLVILIQMTKLKIHLLVEEEGFKVREELRSQMLKLQRSKLPQLRAMLQHKEAKKETKLQMMVREILKRHQQQWFMMIVTLMQTLTRLKCAL